MASRSQDPAHESPPAPSPGFERRFFQQWDAFERHAASVPYPTFLVLVLATLILAGFRCREQLNQDGIAYLRTARYWSEGQWDLAINPYWSPLWSWSCIPFLKAGLPPLATARITMAASALVFIAGSIQWMKSHAVNPESVRIGRWIIAAHAAFWSVRHITPDLLAAGLWLAALALQSRSPLPSPRTLLLAGALTGAAALAKAVFLPVGIVTTIVLLAHHHALSKLPRRILPWFGGLAFLVLPWILTLSTSRGHLVWSEAPAFARALTRPPHLLAPIPSMSELHWPPNGRITSWELPTQHPPPSWSALDSPAAALHQARILASSLFQQLWILTRWDGIGLALAATLVQLFRKRCSNVPAPSASTAPGPASPIQSHRLNPQALVPAAVLVLAYLPFPWVASNPRFLQATLPILWISSWSALRTPPATQGSFLPRCARIDGIAFTLVAAGSLALAAIALPDIAQAGPVSVNLARTLRTHERTGPIAGSGLLRGGRTGLFTAFHLDTPWLGDDRSATPDDWIRAGAHLVIVNRGSPQAQRLEGDARFTNLDPILFPDTPPQRLPPAQVWEPAPKPARPPHAPPTR